MKKVVFFIFAILLIFAPQLTVAGGDATGTVTNFQMVIQPSDEERMLQEASLEQAAEGSHVAENNSPKGFGGISIFTERVTMLSVCHFFRIIVVSGFFFLACGLFLGRYYFQRRNREIDKMLEIEADIDKTEKNS